METKVERKISDLEHKASSPETQYIPTLPAEMRNKVEITDGSITAIYIGRFYSFYYGKDRRLMDGVMKDVSHVSATVSLSRYELSPYTQTKKKLVRVFPPRYERENVPMVREKLLWRIKKWFYDEIPLFTGGVSTSYRTVLKEKIERKHKVVVTDELMEMVFGPLEKQVANWFSCVNDSTKVK